MAAAASLLFSQAFTDEDRLAFIGIVPSGAALRWEARWIAALKPRDNVDLGASLSSSSSSSSSFFDGMPLPF